LGKNDDFKLKMGVYTTLALKGLKYNTVYIIEVKKVPPTTVHIRRRKS